MTAVAALPDAIAVAREHYAVLDILQELAIALLVVLLDCTYATHSGSNLCEAFLVSLLSHAIVHVGPLEVLASSSVLQVLYGILDSTTLQILEPHLCVLLLVLRCLLEESCNLLIALLASL